jgi:two-component system alkaline phosphatase synthesis response regulator PhoP
MDNSEMKILIADDEPDIIEIISFHLKKAGFEVITASDGSEAIEKAKLHTPDCIILDIMMPKRTGFEVCEYLRSNSQFDKTLIVLLTALNDEASHIKGLELGGDDFVSKPISPKVLLSRITALFRRIQPANSENKIVQIKDLSIDPAQYKTTLNGITHSLAKKEFELL